MGEFSGREPCPARILDDVGGAFTMGVVGGGIFHSIKGIRNAPRGLANRAYYALDTLKARAPITGGAFAAWGGLFAVFDCSFAAIRQKEDPWNSIMSGAATGGVLAARAGPRAAGTNALIGGVLLAAIEGLGIVLTKMFAPKLPTQEEMRAQGLQDPLEPPTPASALGGLTDIFQSSDSSGFNIFGSDSSSSSSSMSDFSAPPPTSDLPPEPEPEKKPWYQLF